MWKRVNFLNNKILVLTIQISVLQQEYGIRI